MNIIGLAQHLLVAMLATERQCSTPAEFAAEPAAALLDDLSDYARHCTTRV